MMVEDIEIIDPESNDAIKQLATIHVKLRDMMNQISEALSIVEIKIVDISIQQSINVEGIRFTPRQYVDILVRELKSKFNFEDDIESNHTRSNQAVKFRHVLMYLLKKKTKWSLSEIGKICSKGRVDDDGQMKYYDHATVLHAIRCINSDIATFKKTHHDQRGTVEIIDLFMRVFPTFHEMATQKIVENATTKNDVNNEFDS